MQHTSFIIISIKLLQATLQNLQLVQVFAALILMGVQLSYLLFERSLQQESQLLYAFAAKVIQRGTILLWSDVNYFLNKRRSTCFVRNIPIQPSTGEAFNKPPTLFYYILKREIQTSLYPCLLSQLSYGQSAGGHSGRQYHQRIATSFTNFSLGSSSSILTLSTLLCRMTLASSSSSLLSLLSFLLFFYVFFLGVDDSYDQESSYDDQSDSSLYDTCLRFCASSFCLNQGKSLEIFFSTLPKLSLEFESQSSIVLGSSQRCWSSSFFRIDSSIFRASSSLLLRFSSFLVLISSSLCCSSASSLASSSLSRLSLLVLRLVTITCINYGVPTNRSSPIYTILSNDLQIKLIILDQRGELISITTKIKSVFYTKVSIRRRDHQLHSYFDSEKKLL